MRLRDLVTLQAKVVNLPEASWRDRPHYALFTVGEFGADLQQLANDPEERLWLIGGKDLLPS